MIAASRAFVYGSLGWSMDRVVTTMTGSVRRRRVIMPRSGFELVPIYGLALPLFEPVHDSMRSMPRALRACVYGLGFIAAEYAVSRSVRAISGRAPWDYTGARWSIQGHTRIDYLPLWAIAGIALEAVHDRLTSRY